MSNNNNNNDSTFVTAQTFWDGASSLIAKTEQHPFLVSMVDGTLEEDNFKYYVVQDALYLKDFADCLRRVAAKAPTVEDAARLVDFARGAEECELELHNSFFEQWNINTDDSSSSSIAEEEAKQMPNCLLYTSYMKRVVATESYAQGLAVLLPCFWVYMHVGHVMLRLRKDLDENDNNNDDNNDDETSTEPTTTRQQQRKRKPQYDAWIDMYAGDEFEKEVKDFIAMVNAECERLQKDTTSTSTSTTVDKEEKESNSNDNNDKDTDTSTAQQALKRMQHHFTMGCKLEHMFWDQASTMMQWPEF